LVKKKTQDLDEDPEDEDKGAKKNQKKEGKKKTSKKSEKLQKEPEEEISHEEEDEVPEDEEEEDTEELDVEEEEEEDEEEEEEEEEEEDESPAPRWFTDHSETRNLMMMANATPFGSLLAYMSMDNKKDIDRDMVRYQIAQNLIVSLFTFWWLPLYAIYAAIAILKAKSGECWEFSPVTQWAHYWVDKGDDEEE
jgi:hypothetical protein